MHVGVLPAHVFPCTEHQQATGTKAIGKLVDNPTLLVTLEVDQYVLAENNVEVRERRTVDVQQIAVKKMRL